MECETRMPVWVKRPFLVTKLRRRIVVAGRLPVARLGESANRPGQGEGVTLVSVWGVGG